MQSSAAELIWQGDTLSLSGELFGPDAEALVSVFRQAPLPPGGRLRIMMVDLDLEDGVSVAEMVNALRALLARGCALELHEAPQMLAHTLYKVNMLASQPITLVAPREDEGTTAN